LGSLPPDTEEQQAEAVLEDAQQMTYIKQQNLAANAALFQRQSIPMLQRFDLETNRELIS